MSIKDIANEILQLESEIAAKKKTLAQAEAKLQETIQDKVTAELATKDYGCGTVNIVEDDIKIKVVVSKKVKWDNSQLERIYNDIKESGADVSAYLKISYTVNENNYKAWGDNIQAYFEPARTVEVSKPAIKIERV